MVLEKHSASSIWKVEETGAESNVVISVDRLDACRFYLGASCSTDNWEQAQSEWLTLILELRQNIW